MTYRSLGIAVMVLVLDACNGEIYVRDGVTDGDTFYLAKRALHDSDPVLQSWVSYSLTRSACQLQIGDENPARATSFECELTAREHLVETWSTYHADGTAPTDHYLDTLLRVKHASHLDEYVWHFFRVASWQMSKDLDVEQFAIWRQRHLGQHEPETRLIGSWGYSRPAGAEPSGSGIRPPAVRIARRRAADRPPVV